MSKKRKSPAPKQAQEPVKARLVARAHDWPWSSVAAHVDRRRTSVAESDWLGDLTAGWVCNWRQYLLEPTDAALAKTILRHENTGRPLGDAGFVAKLEARLGRILAPLKPGPKPKKKAKHAATKTRK